ncbi:MAG TPA: zf-HC2 domain-containing protein, partial [Byssovorax sp.]
MKRAACPMEALVEASFDGRVDERDARALARHLEACAACAAWRASLVDLRARAAVSADEPP